MTVGGAEAQLRDWWLYFDLCFGYVVMCNHMWSVWYIYSDSFTTCLTTEGGRDMPDYSC